jgi:hypothetical protein
MNLGKSATFSEGLLLRSQHLHLGVVSILTIAGP